MNSVLGSLKPERLWKHFESILGIPHGSGNEKALAEYIISVAEAAGLDAKLDKIGNVIVRKPASTGLAGRKGVILQAHMDMVCEKNSNTVHDFLKEGIEPEIRDGWVYAKGTTLGSDNGIGVAAGLAIMEDKSLVHGPLEFLFTVDEETGLTGANNLSKTSLNGNKLLNLDSEDEGTFTIGCAGGGDTEITLALERKKSASKNLFKVMLTGFRGGHSGIEINQGRGNAVKLLARMLVEAGDSPFDLVSFDGGSKRNAIAREAWAVISCDPLKAAVLKKKLARSFADIKTEFQYVEKDASFIFQRIKDEKAVPMARCSKDTLLGLILSLPHGVMAMHQEIKDMVETSTNLAIVNTGARQARIVCNTRSAVASSLAAVRLNIRSVAALAGASAVLKDAYPGWTPDLSSQLVKSMKDIYVRMFSREPKIEAIHAGLECGLIGQKYPKMEMISFGPTLKSPHSPDEHVDIESVEKFWRLIIGCLAEL